MSLSRELGLTCITAYKMDATKAVLKAAAEATQPPPQDLQQCSGVSCYGGPPEIGGDREGRDSRRDPGPNVEGGHTEGEFRPALDRPCMSSVGAEKVLQRRQRKEAAKAARGLLCPPLQQHPHCEASSGGMGWVVKLVRSVGGKAPTPPPRGTIPRSVCLHPCRPMPSTRSSCLAPPLSVAPMRRRGPRRLPALQL